MKNRRRERRIHLSDSLNAVITYSDALRKVPGGYIGDISGGGMFMLTDTVLDKDAYVTMKLNTEPFIGKPVFIQGLVVRSDTRGMAIQFTYANDDDISSLMSF